MSWGYRIIIVLGIFLIGMSTMVYVSMRQTNEMIDTNYYEKELAYQNVIDAKQRLNATGSKVAIEQTTDSLKLIFPSSFSDDISTGTITFLKMADSKADRNINISNTVSAIHQIPVKDFQKGWYKVRIQWVDKGLSYYQEQNFLVR